MTSSIQEPAAVRCVVRQILRLLAISGLICVTGAGTAYGNDRAPLTSSTSPQALLRGAQDGEATPSAPAASSAGYVTLIVGAVVLQAILVAALLAQRSRRRQAEETLRVREATLQTSYWRIRQLVGGLIHAEEAARVAMARDLHDDICQEMVGMAVSLHGLIHGSGLIQDDRTQGTLAMLHRRALDVTDRIRQISHELHPHALQLLGLAPAMKTHCTEVATRYKVPVAFHTAGDLKRIHPDCALCLFRIAQEALRNAAVHGTAGQIEVSIVRVGDDVELAVHDDGCGFDPALMNRDSRGLGLVSIEERAHAAGGELMVVSQPGHGTTIFACVPAGEPR